MTVGGNTRCLEIDVNLRKLYVSECSASNENQRWEWGNSNSTALVDYERNGAKAF